MKNISDESREKIRQGAINSSKTRLENAIKNYKLLPTLCENCHQELPYEKRNNSFCSQSCAATFNNKQKQRKIKLCIHCGKELHAGKKYCNSICQSEYEFNKKIQQIDNNELQPSLRLVKRILLKKYNNKCQKCGWGETNKYTNKIPLEAHHKDGNSENNSMENIELLCPNCHSLTKTHKGANKTNTRSYRKKYYNYQNKDGAPTQNQTEIP